MTGTKVDPILQVDDLKVHFPIRRGVLRRQVGAIRAVDGVSLQVQKGETLGLVGESGCGKSTTARAILQLIRPTSGTVTFQGEDLTTLSGGELREKRRHMQMIFQDPYASLNRRMTVRRIVEEPLVIHGTITNPTERQEKVEELLETVGLDPAHMSRYPYAFSGGQRQRIGIARALALQPDLIVCDEPISALDVSIQAQVVNLLKRLQHEFGLTYVFIAHDLSMVRHISDRVAVMYLGKIVEVADSDSLYGQPLHPYTRALISAVPVPSPRLERTRERVAMAGELPSPRDVIPGCKFASRCPFAVDVCRDEEPVLRDVGVGRQVACHREAEGIPIWQQVSVEAGSSGQ